MKVLILGGTSPIARLLAIKFASIGAHLYIASRDEAEGQRIAHDIQIRSGVPAIAGKFDATDFASHAELIERAGKELGGELMRDGPLFRGRILHLVEQQVIQAAVEFV